MLIFMFMFKNQLVYFLTLLLFLNTFKLYRISFKYLI